MIKLKNMLNEGAGWLTKVVYSALEKESKRIAKDERRKYKSFDKAFSTYVHDLDSIKYDKLGKKRFDQLHKAIDYIEKKENETFNKLTRRALIAQFDGPVYAMLVQNRYNLEEK